MLEYREIIKICKWHYIKCIDNYKWHCIDRKGIYLLPEDRNTRPRYLGNRYTFKSVPT